MTSLVVGVLLFACVHFIPSLAPSLKANVLTKIGEDAYKGVFSLLLLGAFCVIIVGWRSVVAEPIYLSFPALHKVALWLLACAFLVMAANTRQSRLRLLIRHPLLTGVVLWSVSHLLLNGDPPSWSAELVTLLIAAITVAVIIYLHPWLSGILV